MRRIFVLSLALVFTLTAFSFAEKLPFKPVDLPKDVPMSFGYVPGEIVVQFTIPQKNIMPRMDARGIATLGVSSLDAIAVDYEVTGIKQLFRGSKPKMVKGRTIDLSRYHKIKFNPNISLDEVMEAYRGNPYVESVEPIGIHRVYATPNDGNFPEQWHLNQASDHDIDAPEAWDIETGSDNIIVAILDSGVRYFHKDLGGSNASYSNPGGADGNMWINWAEKNGSSGVDDDGNGFVDDWIGWDFVDGGSNCWSGEDCYDQDNDPRDFNGHGTHCAGNVGAINNNGYGTCAPSGGWGNGTLQPTGNGVSVMACRIGWSGRYYFYEVGYVRMDFIAEALYYAADNGADIASCSWGSSNTGGLAAAVNYFVASGGLIFKAAGNDGSQTADYMCSRSDVISVAATDSTDNGADFTTYGTWVDICAPGTGILSCYHDHNDPQSDYVAAMDGTSMSTPLAASVAALIWSQNQSWTANQVEEQLYASAENIDAYLSSKYIGKMGAGRINAYEAVNTGTPPPVADFSGSPTTGCVPLAVNFTDQSTGEITSWSWDFGDGGTSTAQNPSHTYNAVGNYTVELTVTGPGGSDTETKTNYITVNDAPVADFVGSPTSGDYPLNVDFTDLSTNDPTGWDWDFGDGGSSTAKNPSHTYNSAGTYTVTLTATNVCGSDVETKVDYITVTEPPVPPTAAFSGTPTSGCAPLDVSFTDESTGDITSWSWDFGDGGTSTVQSPSHTYNAAGNYTVELTVTGPGGSDTETRIDYITVTAAPVADFSGSPTSGTEPLTVDFTDLSTNNPTSWSWDFGDGGTSTVQNPSHEYTTAGTYTVELTATNACGSDVETKVDYITVNPCNAPVADFVGSPTSGDYPLNVDFTDLSTNDPTGWDWDFGDGGSSTAKNPSHTYNAAGTYTVTLTATNVCGSDVETKVDYITVTEPPVPPIAAFSGTPTSGCAPLDVSFTDESTGDITSWSWDFGDGGTSTVQNPSHTYNAAGDYTVELTVTGPGGSDTETRVDYITVMAAPVANFSGSPTSGDYPLTVNFTDLSTNNPLDWSWNFGDGGISSAQNPSHTYEAAGTYTVSLTVANDCGDDTETKTDYITVTEPQQNTMYVYKISVSRQTFWLWSRGLATVSIYDTENSPVANATVYGTWSGASSGNVSGVTGSDGRVSFSTGWMRTPSNEWCFEVTDVTHASYVYDRELNKMTKACESGPVYSAGPPLAARSRVVPETYSLMQNHPNPFNATTTISFTLDEASSVRLEVYNIVGQHVTTLADGFYGTGRHSVLWDAGNAASGVYFYRITTDKVTETKKMMLMK